MLPGGVHRRKHRVPVVHPVAVPAHAITQPAETRVQAAVAPPAATLPAVLRLVVPQARGTIEQTEMQRERRETLPPALPQSPDPGADAPGGSAGHAGGAGGGMLVAFLAAFFFVAPGLTQWLWAGTERRPRLLRAGRLERPG
jgi:hypothetical protein